VINSSDRPYRRGKEKGGLYAINICQSLWLLVPIGQKGGKRNDVEKERWERNPEGEGDHITQIFYISVNSCEGKREINVGKETSESV